jgi:hypothetical protein
MAHECLGSTDAPPVLLIMGAGSQLINWPDGFCTELVGVTVCRSGRGEPPTTHDDGPRRLAGG